MCLKWTNRWAFWTNGSVSRTKVSAAHLPGASLSLWYRYRRAPCRDLVTNTTIPLGSLAQRTECFPSLQASNRKLPPRVTGHAGPSPPATLPVRNRLALKFPAAQITYWQLGWIFLQICLPAKSSQYVTLRPTTVSNTAKFATQGCFGGIRSPCVAILGGQPDTLPVPWNARPGSAGPSNPGSAGWIRSAAESDLCARS